MRYHDTLDDVLGQKSKVKILRVLTATRMELSGREIARSAKLAQRIVHASLFSLFKSGIVLMRRSGKSNLYRLNLENILSKEALAPLFEFEKSLLKNIVEIIRKKIPLALSIILFGSVAEGSEQDNSDIDFLIVLPQNASITELEKVVDYLNLEISKRFGNGISPVLIKLGDFKKRYKTKDSLIRNISENGQVLYGKSPMELIYDK